MSDNEQRIFFYLIISMLMMIVANTGYTAFDTTSLASVKQAVVILDILGTVGFLGLICSLIAFIHMIYQRTK